MKNLLLLFITVFTFNFTYSQDKIFLKSKENIETKILEINVDEVKYKKYSNLEGPTFTILKSDIHMIIYENGESEIFKNQLINDEISLNKSDENMFSKGQRDASLYYKGYKGAGTGTLFTSLLSPIVGLIPAIATSSTQPNYNNLSFPDEKLMENSDYFMGYTKKAKKIKQGRVWTNWAIGFGANLVAILILSSS
jgi:hypothetical protein